MNARPGQAREIFIAAVKLAPDQWDAFLKTACDEDESLRNRVQNLLVAHREAGSFLEPAADRLLDVTEDRDCELPGNIIGPYKLLQQIGEGGMGIVFMAEQTHPVQRKVALKVIKPGMDSKQVIARFEAERQALALMDHVNIARVIDGGTTESGRPFFVMELVNGVPITKYCDDNHLTPRERLELFIPVCQAIQHAHQKGIIHRDIKPSNVLVTLYDGKPVPKVIDFGVAKAMEQKLSEHTLFTNFGTMVGTLEYMSPEQAEMNNLGVDTRSDIYSLGVLLYELLTGTTPLTRKRIKEAANLEILRLIKEEEPQKPSTRLSESGDALASISANRHTEPSKLTKLVRGELDWIVMKTLEKDRNRRYETANGLAVELQRYLADEPVLACPPSKWYRVRKFVRRNKGAVISAILVLLALVCGVVGTTYGLFQANEQRDRAVFAEGETRKRANELKLISDFQTSWLMHFDPRKVGNLLTTKVQTKLEKSLTAANVPPGERAGLMDSFAALWRRINTTDVARELIDQTVLMPAEQQINIDLASQPIIAAQLRQALTYIYLDLGLYDKAQPLLHRALISHRQLLGEEHPETLRSLKSTGQLLQKQGNFKEAEQYFREVVEKCRRVYGENDAKTASAINDLSLVLVNQGKLSEAEPFSREAFDKYRRISGEENSNTLSAMSNLGRLLVYQKKLTEAEPLLRNALEKLRRLFGDAHISSIATIASLADLLQAQGKLGETTRYRREALELCSKSLGAENPETLKCLGGLATALYDENKLKEAEPYARKTLEQCRLIHGANHKETLRKMCLLSAILVEQSKFSEAEPICREVLQKGRDVFGKANPETIRLITNLGVCLRNQGKLNEAETFLREAVDLHRLVIGAEHPDTLRALYRLGKLLLDQRKLDEAEQYLRECLAIREKTQPDTWSTFNTMSMLGGALLGQKKYADAEPLLLKGYEGMKAREKAIPLEGKERLPEAIERLAQLYEETGKKDKAEEWRRKLPVK